MSDKDFEITTIDSLMNLSGKTDEHIAALISELGLSFSPEFWGEVHKCLTAEKITPSYELLFFFDAIFLASKKDIKNAKIIEAVSDDTEIALSFCDAQKKAEYLKKGSALPLSDILKISSEYLGTLDAKAPETVGEGKNIVISGENGKALLSLGIDKKPLRYGYVKENEIPPCEARAQYLPEGIDIFILSGDTARLTESEEFSALKTAEKTLGEKGLLYTLLEMCYGVKINADELNLTSLPTLVSGFCGQKLVAAQSNKYDNLFILAEGYGVGVTKIATSLSVPVARIATQDGEINIKTGFLRRLFSFEEKLRVKLPAEQTVPTKYEKLFFSIPFEEENGVLSTSAELRGHTVAARYTKELSFVSGMNTVLDSLFAILASGADRRGAGITIKLCMRRENLEGGLSALLGAYRAIMELCLPEINSEITFSDEDYIICAAFARQGIRPYGAYVSQRKLYLLSFLRLDNSLPRYMPSFSELRKMCDYLMRLISDGTALSVRAVNGTVAEATRGMRINYEGSISERTVAQGFIIETLPEVKINAPFIGILKDEDFKNTNTEETV